ncbi:tapasin-related -like protein [Labeo rohita]|uniref:Tapasin-related-like protein n=1 Tax=Labeo rohita TaxID=84645 RepID=A0A498MUA3_LABRO|nr:tapasin-related -like protein [Labeo rohita]
MHCIHFQGRAELLRFASDGLHGNSDLYRFVKRVNGSQSLYDLQWLPCPFVDEKVHINEEGHIETEYFTREAVLHFGNVGDKPLHPTIIFLVTASKVDMRHYLEGTEDKLLCEIRRYSTGRNVMRWPTAGAQDHDVWFSSTLRHSEGLLVITTFLRHTTVAPAEDQADFLQWNKINDRDLLTTSGVQKQQEEEKIRKVGRSQTDDIYSTNR